MASNTVEKQIERCLKELKHNPNSQLTVKHLANLYTMQGQYYKVLECVGRLLEMNEQDYEAFYMGAAAYLNIDDVDNALILAKQAILLKEDYVSAYMIMAFCYDKNLLIEENIIVLKKIIALAKPIKTQNQYDFLGQAWLLLANVYHLLGNNEQAKFAYLQLCEVLAGAVNKSSAYSSYLMCLHYDAKVNEKEMFMAHKKYNMFFEQVKPYEHLAIKPKKRLRIGYISPDFRQHAVIFFSYQLLVQYNPAQFEIYCYSKGKPDQTTVQLQKLAVNWRAIQALGDSEAAKIIYEDKIDILVDLSGHTANNCLPILAYKPAPIQLCGIGYFNTTGLSTVDYFITDQYVDPVGTSDAFFSETLIRLPQSHFCYTARSDAPECQPAPCTRNKVIQFCSFNNFAKVTDEVLGVWLEILKQVPNSKLVLKNKLFGSAYGCKQVNNRLLRLGFSLEQVEFRKSTGNHMEEYLDMDIALDTFPYPGGATTCEAMYMGVPVVTLAGNRHGSRFGYSILKNIGFEGGIAYNKAEYIEKAVKLAMDKVKLNELHQTLRDRMMNSPLMDGKTYVNTLEEVYQTIWNKLIEDKNITPIAIDDAQLSQKRQELIANLNNQEYEILIGEAKKILAVRKDDCEIFGLLAAAYIEINENKHAIQAIRQAMKINKNYLGGLVLLARAYYQNGNEKETIDTLQNMLAKYKNNMPEQVQVLAYNLLANTWRKLGNAKKSTINFLKASQIGENINDKALNYSNYLFDLNYLEDKSQVEMLEAHMRYNDIFKGVEQFRHENRRRKTKLKIGYISPDFRHHVVVFFSYQLLAKYDHNKFEVTCYAKGKTDDTTKQLQGLVDHWHNVNGMDDDAIAKLIYEEEIDILVDLAGHTANNCLSVLARKPAPIQLCGIGYFNTIGLKTIDYFLTDQYCDPAGQNDAYFSEKLLRLPHSHFCYTPPSGIPECQAAACERNEYITFGSFNNFTKTTDEMLVVWRKILEKVPHSKLVLKSAIFGSAYGLKKVRGRLKNLGFKTNQLDLRAESMDYLQQYHEIDIALDTYPYPGGGTTCEALYMGVPVITLAGERHGSRFGYSILKNIGLEECIAFTKDEYVMRAVDLANNKERVKEIHQSLRNQMICSPLMNGKLYMQDVEKAYQEIWREFTKNTLEEKNALEVVLMQHIAQKEYQAAIQCGEKILEIDASDCKVMYQVAEAYYNLKAYDKAIAVAKRLLEIEENYLFAYSIIAFSYQDMGNAKGALEAFEKNLEIAEKLKENMGAIAELWQSIGASQLALGNIKAASDAYLTASQLDPHMDKKLVKYSNYLFTLNYRDDISTEFIFKAHAAYSQLFEGIQRYEHTGIQYKEKLKIGYISYDFCSHVVALFVYELLARHNKEKFHVTCYYARDLEDDVTRNFQSLVESWRDIHGISADEAAKMIYEDGINILVDLSAHTANNCLPILARKPAPIQISGIGYMNTTGLKEVDYFLSDVYCDPAGMNDEFFTEQLIRLPHTHFCYIHSNHVPDCKDAPCLAQETITFGCFNDFKKVTDRMLLLWLHILENVKHSRLILKSKGFDNPYFCEREMERLKRIGFNEEQIEFRSFSDDFFNQYNEIDIALDTYPYVGGTTTFDALYMGVPVVSLAGTRHGTRFGYSILKNIGLEEGIAFTEEQYVEKAAQLANDKQKLSELHRTLRKKLADSFLMNGKQYVEDVEKKYQEIWREKVRVQNIETVPSKDELKAAVRLHKKNGQYQEALGCISYIFEHFDADTELMYDLAEIYYFMGDNQRGFQWIKKLLLLGTDSGLVYFLQAKLYYAEQNIEETLIALSEVFKRDIEKLEINTQSQVYDLLGNIYWKYMADAEKALISLKKASELRVNIDEKPLEYSNYLFLTNHVLSLNYLQLAKEHQQYNVLFNTVKQYEHNDLKVKEKLKIGYISPDFCMHPVTRFCIALLTRYDKCKFHVTCYAKVAEPDRMTEFLQGKVDQWRDISQLSSQSAGQMIYEDDIDILVDLSGHTANNCLPVLAYKPAPVQFCGIGYVNTTGLKAVDYYITDQYCSPAGINKECFTEQLVRLPHTHFCYTPDLNTPECQEAPCMRNNYITFGCFNKFTKASDKILILWLNILNQMPNAKLVLKNTVFNHEISKDNIRARLQALGYSDEQVEFRAATNNWLEEYNDIDIALDTYPCAGGTTTFDALYMGVPVITLVGKRHAARFGYSILKNIALDECIAFNEAEYVMKAVALANDQVKISELHKTLRRKMIDSPLMNEQQYTNEVEEVYQQIWDKIIKKKR